MKSIRAPLTASALVLASTTALVAVSDAATARSGGGHQDKSHQTNAQVAMGTPSRDMTSKLSVMSRQKGSKSSNAETYKKHKGCGKLIVPTAGCPTPARDPVGNTRPSLPTEAKQPTKSRQPILEYATKPGPQSANQPASAPPQRSAPTTGPVVAQPQNLPPHDPVGNTHPDLNANGVATVSNGVSKATVPNLEGGLLVTSKTPGTITVSNGTNSVTLPGGSVSLSGARSVGGGADVQIVRQPNGDITVAAAPPRAPAPGTPTAGQPAPANPAPGNHSTGPASITLTTDDLKTAGKVVGVAAGVVSATPAALGNYMVAPGAIQLGATAVVPIAGAVAGYGLAKGGVSGAGDALKDSAGAVKDVTKDAAGAVKDVAKDAAKDVGGAVKDAASAIGDLF